MKIYVSFFAYTKYFDLIRIRVLNLDVVNKKNNHHHKKQCVKGFMRKTFDRGECKKKKFYES